VDDFDAFDHRRVDRMRIARAVAQRRRLRHAVDHVQRLPAAQRFAEAGQLLPRRRERRNQVGQHLRQVLGQRQLLFELGTVDHSDGVRQRGLGIRQAAGAGRDDDAVEVGRRLGGGLCFLGERRYGENGQQGAGEGRAGHRNIRQYVGPAW
jgi:hypothetical protein